MKNFGKWMLGAAIVAGGLGLGATSAQAAEFRIVIGSRAAYIPPCPGPGYEWVAGYYNDGYWVPGYWNNVGVTYRYDRGRDRDFHRERHYFQNRAFYRNNDRDYRRFDRDEHREHRDRFDGRFDRDDHRDHDGDHFRR
jgi:hypothetical protein